jgi:hypothetical protein
MEDLIADLINSDHPLDQAVLVQLLEHKPEEVWW